MLKKYFIKILITVALLFIFSMLLFFFVQNKEDLYYAFEHKSDLDYDAISLNCKEVKMRDCFLEKYDHYLKNSSLTGVSIALNHAFSFLEDDKKNTKEFSDEKIKGIDYAIFYLKINNHAMEEANKKYLGLDFFYGFYLSALYSFYSKAFEFSENYIETLESENEGIPSLPDGEEKDKYSHEFKVQKDEYLRLRQVKEEFLEALKQELTAKRNS